MRSRSQGEARRESERESRGSVAVLVAAPVLAVAACLGGLALTGQLAAAQLLDPGAVVRYGLPIARVLHDTAATVAIGLLVIAVLTLPDPSRDRWALTGLRRDAVRWAGIALSVWAAAELVVLVLTCSDVTGLRLGDTTFQSQVVFFALHVELGRIMVAALVVIVIAAHLALLATRLVTAGWAAACAVGALFPLALGGHAAASDDHVNAVNSLGVHLIGVTVWVGGVAALFLLHRRIVRAGVLDVVAHRFSTLAAWCFAAVALSGLDSAWLRLGGWEGLATRYGVLVLAKAGALVGLGLIGWQHRRRLLPGLAAKQDDGRAFSRLLGGELMLMAFATGVAVALARSAPSAPSPADPNSVYRSLVGFDPPPPMSLTTLFTQWYLDRVLLAGCLVLAAGYLVWVLRLGRRGETWPRWRSACWLAGWLLLVWLTSGGPLVYGQTSFSGHVILHLLLMLGAPPLLVLGAPVTLALAVLPARGDLSAGPREWLQSIVNSRLLGMFTHPVAAGVLFTGSLAIFYSTGLFPSAVSTHSGHMSMTVYFLAVGYLFAWSLLGPDPGPGPQPPRLRFAVLLVVMVVHGLLAAGLHATTRLLAPQWWPQLGSTDGVALLADQRHGAVIGAVAGETLLLAMLIGVALLGTRAWAPAGPVRSDGGWSGLWRSLLSR